MPRADWEVKVTGVCTQVEAVWQPRGKVDGEGYSAFPGAFDASDLVRTRDELEYRIPSVMQIALLFNRRSGWHDPAQRADGGKRFCEVRLPNDPLPFLMRVSDDTRLFDQVRSGICTEAPLMGEKLSCEEPLPDSVVALESRGEESSRAIHYAWAYHRSGGYSQEIPSSAMCKDACPHGEGPPNVWFGTQHHRIGHVTVQGTMPDGIKAVPGLVAPAGSLDAVVRPDSVIVVQLILLHNSGRSGARGLRFLMVYSDYLKGCDMARGLRSGVPRLSDSPWQRPYIRVREGGALLPDQFRASSCPAHAA